MICSGCGSTQFEEENGLFYCCFCQTQSQGFSQEAEQTFIDRSKVFVKEITSKKKVRHKDRQKTGVLWTTTEAFGIILMKQMNKISEMVSNDTQLRDEFKSLTPIVWLTYLRKSGLAFTPNESDDDNQPVRRRLHPASRFRDQQILTNKVTERLPPFKNGSTALGFKNLFKIGANGVIRTVEEWHELEDYDLKRTKDEIEYELYDVFYDRYRDPRSYAKSKSYELKISKETQKILQKLLSETDLETSFEKTIDLLKEDFDSSQSTDVSKTDTDSDNSPEEADKAIESKDSVKDEEMDENWFENDSNYDDYDKDLMRNSTESTKRYLKYIPLSYLKVSKHNSSEFFIDFMSLPKTLSILHIVLRLISSDIYCFDLIRWAHEKHIPYNNCLTSLPDDWLFISNDFSTFTSPYVPSSKTISTLSARVAKYIRIHSFPRPNLEKLLIRFAKDLNLPKDIVAIIQNDYNLFDHFPDKLDRPTNNCRTLLRVPYYERWALMAIVIVLNRIFVLDDSSEKRLSRSARGVNDLFIWNDWERHTRLRLELIRSYFIPLYSGNIEDIRDTGLIADHMIQRTDYETMKPIHVHKKGKRFKELEFRTDIQTEFNALLLETEFKYSEPLKPSLYPITNATDFALKRINSSAMSEEMAKRFDTKRMIPWICSHGKTFHRGYSLLAKDTNQWSDSFKLLIDLSCIVLHCRSESLIPIINQMEKTYFGKKAD